MTQKEIIKYSIILKEKKIKITGKRLELLKVISGLNKSFTLKELNKLLLEKIDEATIFRNLKLFEQCSLIHHIPAEGKAKTFVLTIDENKSKNHSHVHFNCKNCGRTYCMDYTSIKMNLPKGFNLNSLEVIAEGICNSCC